MRHRVLMVTNNYQPYAGGVVQSVRASRDALRQRGHDVIIATLDFRGSEPEGGVVRLFSPVCFAYRTNQMAIAWQATRQLRALVDDYTPTIIHTHHPFLLGMAAYTVARSCNLPVVFTHHTLYDRYLHYAPLPAWITKPIVMQRVAAYCRQVDAVVAPTAFVQQCIAESYGIEESRISVIPSALYAFEQTALSKRLGSPLELITVSRFTPEKRVHLLLDVLTLLRAHYPALSWRMRIVGYGYLESELKHYAYATCRLSSDQVLFITPQSRDALRMLYDESHLFLFASQSETQGLVLAEALACGLPTLALCGPAIEDTVAHEVTGMVVNSCEELADAIASLSADRIRYERFSASALSAATRYGLAQHGDLLISVYNSVIKNS